MMVDQCFFLLLLLIQQGLTSMLAHDLDNIFILPLPDAGETIHDPAEHSTDQHAPLAVNDTIPPELPSSKNPHKPVYFLPLVKHKSNPKLKNASRSGHQGMSKLKSRSDKKSESSASRPSRSSRSSKSKSKSKGKGGSKMRSKKGKGKGKGRYPGALFSESPAPSLTPSPTMLDAENNATTTSPAPSDEQTISPNMTTSPGGPTTFIPSGPPNGLTFAPVPTPPLGVPECYSNTTLLFQAMLSVSSSVDIVYILCPNTVFNIGVDDANGVCCVNGMARLNAKSRSHIKCGESGSSQNNCTLLGGQVQLLSQPQTFGEETTTGVVIQGITFEAAIDMGAVLGSIGDVTFVDCIFKNHVNRAPVFVSYRGPTTGRTQRELLDDNEHSNNSLGNIRDLQVSQQPLVQAVTFTDCVFQGNQQGNDESLPLTQYGVVTATTEFNPLAFGNCVFTNNTYSSSGGTGGYAIATGGSSLSIRDTCIYQNNFAGSVGAIQQYGGMTLTVNNYASDNGNNLTCTFMAKSDLRGRPADSAGNITCVESDATICANNVSDTPSSPVFLSVAPSTQAPTTTPSTQTPTTTPAISATSRSSTVVSLSTTKTKKATEAPLVTSPVEGEGLSASAEEESQEEEGFTTEIRTKSAGFSLLTNCGAGSWWCHSSRWLIVYILLYSASSLL
jgi:hypothetical protein